MKTIKVEFKDGREDVTQLRMGGFGETRASYRVEGQIGHVGEDGWGGWDVRIGLGKGLK